MSDKYRSPVNLVLHISQLDLLCFWPDFLVELHDFAILNDISNTILSLRQNDWRFLLKVWSFCYYFYLTSLCLPGRSVYICRWRKANGTSYSCVISHRPNCPRRRFNLQKVEEVKPQTVSALCDLSQDKRWGFGCRPCGLTCGIYTIAFLSFVPKSEASFDRQTSFVLCLQSCLKLTHPWRRLGNLFPCPYMTSLYVLYF